MIEYTKTVKNGCKTCGKDAYVVFRKDNPEFPALMQGVRCESRCLTGRQNVLDDEIISRLAWEDPD
jgi:hypothetical protein